MPTSVLITVQDDQSIPQPISGVVIQFFTTLGVFVTSGTTNGSGQVSASLPDATYNLLFYKQGVSILPSQPQQIIVNSLLPSNSFTVTGHVRTLPEGADPAKCRVSGYLVGQDGYPTSDMRISFKPVADLSVVGGNLLSPQGQLEVTSDDSGYFQFDLLRGVIYMAYLRTVTKFPLLSVEPAALLVIGPNQPSVSLPNLLFPLPVSVTFSTPSISIPLAAGADGSSVLGTINYADGSSGGTTPSSRTQMPPFAKLNYVYSDPTLFSLVLGNGQSTVTPYKTGTGTVVMTRLIPPAVFWPGAPAFVSQTLTVTIV